MSGSSLPKTKASMESAITLVVKTPNHRFKDIHIECDLGWTVKKVKDYLANVYPSSPKTVSQRLIYSGHLLKDEQQLKEILSREHDSHTVHIVCPNTTEDDIIDKTKTQPAVSANAETATNGDSNGIRHRNTSTLPSQSPVNSSYNQWNQSYNNQYASYWNAYMQQVQHSPQSMYQHQGIPQHNMSMGYSPQQLYQWQMSMMSMYQQFTPGSSFMNPTNVSLFHTTPVSTPSTPVPQTVPLDPEQVVNSPQDTVPAPPEGPEVDPLQAEAPEQRDQVINNEQRNQNVPMNAGGAMFDDDDENEEGRRDWLDWVHTLLRASVMISIMYFYSSTIRLLMISLLGFIIYLFQTGWLTFRRGGRDRERNGNQNQNQDEHDGVRNQENDIREDPVNVTEENTPDTQQDILEPQQVNTFRAHVNVIYTFVTSFFTSLIPQGVQ